MFCQLSASLRNAAGSGQKRGSLVFLNARQCRAEGVHWSVLGNVSSLEQGGDLLGQLCGIGL